MHILKYNVKGYLLIKKYRGKNKIQLGPINKSMQLSKYYCTSYFKHFETESLRFPSMFLKIEGKNGKC